MRTRRPKRRFLFRITHEGGVFLMLIVIVGMIAFAKGINLIFLVLATMICFGLLPSVISIASVHNLSIERVLPTHVFAGKAFPIELVVTNRKRFVSSLSLVVRDTIDRHKLQARYIVRVPPRASVSTTYRHVIDRRGEYQFGRLVTTTSFPLGFFARGFATWAPETLIVYPRIVRLNPNFLANVLSDIEAQLNRPGIGTEVFGFRRYRDGDDRRFINWKLSAKSDRLLVTQFSQDQNLQVTIVFDNALTERDDEALEQFEELVTFAASLGSFFVEKGFKVQMLTRSGTVPFGEGNKQLLRMLTHLALIQPVEPAEETDDIYSLKRLSNSIGILVAQKPIERPLPHFAHTFHTAGRRTREQQAPALAGQL